LAGRLRYYPGLYHQTGHLGRDCGGFLRLIPKGEFFETPAFCSF
jgi:hypothetical protein